MDSKTMRLVGLYVFTFVAHCSADYYFGPGDVVDGAGYNTDGEDIYMSDGDIYREYWPMDSGLYPGQAAGGAGLHQWPKCIDIPSNLTLCQNLRYNQMRLPNLLEHDTIREVTQQAKSWVPLVGIRCHPDTKLFLCSLFSPVCLDRPIWPCRSLCSAVKMACEGHMNAHGYSWPDMLRCDKFPLDNDLCIGLQNDMKPDEHACEPCNKPSTFESIIHNFCIADFVAKIKVQENVIVDGMTRITAQKKKKVYKAGSWSRGERRQPIVYLEEGGDCDCRPLDDPHNEGSSFMVMGKHRNGKNIVEYFQLYDKKNKELKKALRAIRKGHVCEEGVQALTDKEPQSTDKEERKGRRTNADEDKRKKRRRDEGRRDGARNRRRNRKNDNRRSENSNSARRRNRDTNPVF